MGKKYQRQNGEKLADFQARVRAAEALLRAAEALLRPEAPVKKRRGARSRWAEAADRVDGFDRDNLGESQD